MARLVHMAGLRGLMFCAAVSACMGSAFAQTVAVGAYSDIDGVGLSAGSLPSGASLPPSISLISGEQYLTFSITGGTNVCGSTWCATLNNSNYNDADGIGSASNMVESPSNGISGISNTNAGFLAGVFVSTAPPSGSVPSSLAFGSGGIATSFASLSPALNQLFFIGDGLTGDHTGSVQDFNIPTGATALYLGVADACGYNGSPSCYSDNAGSWQVTYAISGSATPEPGSVWLILAAGAGLCLALKAGFRAKTTGLD